MFRLAPLLITAAAVSDETSLMQGVKPQHVTVKEEKSKSVSNLLETAKTMLKNGATPDVVTFAQTTLEEITDAVLPKIQDAHDADQLLVTQTFNMFQDALTELQEGNVLIAGLYADEVSHSNAHRACRGTGSEARDHQCTNEYCTCEDKRDCDYELWRIWEHFEWEESDLRFKSGEIEDHFCAETANGTTWIFRDYSVSKFPHWITQKLHVESWEAEYDLLRPTCTSRYEAMDDKTAECDGHQLSLEQTSCELANKVREVKNRFADFWVYASETYQQVIDEVHCLEIDRWKEWRSLATVQCLLQATSERNGRPCDETTDGFSSEVARCERVQTDTEITHLRINYHLIHSLFTQSTEHCESLPDGAWYIDWDQATGECREYPPDCATPDAVGVCVHIDRHVPCTPEAGVEPPYAYLQDYVDQEYHGLWQPPQPTFQAPDYNVDSHSEPTTHIFERCPSDASTWGVTESGSCAFVDASASWAGACDCPEFDRSTHHGSFQALRTGNSHCNQRPACVPCNLIDESYMCQIVGWHQYNDRNTGRTHPWVRYPTPEHQCHQATIHQMEEGVFDHNGDGHFVSNEHTFKYGDVGSGEFCPTSDVSEADCLAAVQSLLPTGQTQGRTTLVAGSWGWVPPGCSVQSHRTHGQEGDWAAHFNRGRGTNDGGYTKVCTGPVMLSSSGLSVPATRYHKLGYGMPNCPEGKTIDTHEECEQAHISLGLEVAPKWAGNHGGIPGLCSTREVDWGGGHHFHFNGAPVGVIRVDLSPVCKV